MADVAVIDAYENTEKVLAEAKQKMLDNFDQQLADFITLFLDESRIGGQGPIRLKDRLAANSAVIDDLKVTEQDIRDLPNFAKAQEICDGAGCILTIKAHELPLKNEGLVFCDFHLFVDRKGEGEASNG
jgi:hypothetical protein